MSTHLLLDEKPLMVLPTLAKLVGINESIILQQIHWIIEIKEEHEDDRTLYDGYIWCKYTLNQWHSKLSWITPSGLFRILKRLEENGIVKSCKPNAGNRDQTKWYRIDHEGLNAFSEKCILASSQNESLASSQNESLASSQNDLYKKDLKRSNKKMTGKFSSEVKTSFPEKTEISQVLDNPENQETPPPAPAPYFADPMGDRLKQGKSYNRFTPKGLNLAGFSKWHLGKNYVDWQPDLIKTAIAHLKKHEKPCDHSDATGFLNNICKAEDWAKFEILVEATEKAIANKVNQATQPTASDNGEALPEKCGIPENLRFLLKKSP